MSRFLKFSAIIYKIGINPYVDAPETSAEFFGRRGYIPVVGMVNDCSYRATLVPVGKGRHRLHLNTDIRIAAVADVGDTISLKLKFDTESREIAIPTDFLSALRRIKGGLRAFRDAVPSRRREILRWILGAKRLETRQQRIGKALSAILKAKTRKTKKLRARRKRLPRISDHGQSVAKVRG